MPMNINMLVEAYTEETTPDTLKAVVSLAQLQGQENAPWLSSMDDPSDLLCST